MRHAQLVIPFVVLLASAMTLAQEDPVGAARAELQSPDPATRSAAIQRLVDHRRANAADVLPLINDADAAVREAAARAILGVQFTADDESAVLEMIASPDSAARTQLSAQLLLGGRRPEQHVIDALVGVMRSDADPKVRAALATQLGAVSIPAAAKALDDPASEVRSAAASGMVRATLTRPDHYAVAERLWDLWQYDPSFVVRVAAGVRFEAFCRSGGPALSAARDKLRTGSETERAAAAAMVAHANPNEAELGLLRELVRDDDADVRTTAAHAITRWRPAEGLDLVRSGPADVREAAAIELIDGVFRAAMTDRAVAGKLAELRASDDAEVRLLGALLAEQARVPAAAPVPAQQLIAALESPSRPVRRLAGRVLLSDASNNRARYAHGMVALMSAMEDPDPDVAIDAVETYRAAIGITADRNVLRTANPARVDAVGRLVANDPAERIEGLRRWAALPREEALALWDEMHPLLGDPVPDVRRAAVAACAPLLTSRRQEYVTAAARLPLPPAPTAAPAGQPGP